MPKSCVTHIDHQRGSNQLISKNLTKYFKRWIIKRKRETSGTFALVVVHCIHNLPFIFPFRLNISLLSLSSSFLDWKLFSCTFFNFLGVHLTQLAQPQKQKILSEGDVNLHKQFSTDEVE